MSKVPRDTVEIGIRELNSWVGWEKDTENEHVTLYCKKVYKELSNPSIKVGFSIQKNLNDRVV